MHNLKKILYLTLDDIKSLGFTDDDFFNCVSDIYVQHGIGKADMSYPTGFDVSAERRFNLSAGWVSKIETSGAKWSATFPPQSGMQLNDHTGMLILNDNSCGLPKTIMDSFYISSRCFAATYAVFSRFYARRDAETLGMIGVSHQTKHNIKAIRLPLNKLKTIKLFDVRNGAMTRFADSLAEEFPGELILCRTIEEFLRDTDVLLVEPFAGNREKSKLPDNLLPQKGLFIATSSPCLLQEKTIKRMDKVIVDSVFGSKPGKIYAQQGEVSAGIKCGRETSSENILALNSGSIVLEIYIGDKMYELAREQGIGVELDPSTW